MNGNVLLDTNATIALLNGDQSLVAALQGVTGIYLPAAAVGELYFGAFKSTRIAANVASLEAFLRTNTVLSIDADTARHYGAIRSELRQTGRPIPGIRSPRARTASSTW